MFLSISFLFLWYYFLHGRASLVINKKKNEGRASQPSLQVYGTDIVHSQWPHFHLCNALE